MTDTELRDSREPGATQTSPDHTHHDYSEHAGRVVWPRGTADLTDTTRCPACFTPLRSTVCSSCRLDLSHPAAIELAAVSTGVADALARRLDLIGRIRYETAHPPMPEAATAAAPPAFVPPEAIRPPTPVPAASPVPPAAAPGSTEGAASPRRSGVQLALLITGISLLSVFAVFFLVYAIITYGLVWRSVIVGLITVAAFTGASVLRRRKLEASAEAVAIFAILLVYLDAFALRANALFGLEEVDERAYWGTILVLSALGLVVWHRLSGVRAASIVAYSVVVPGVGALVSSVTDSLGLAESTFAITAAMALAGLAHRTAVTRNTTPRSTIPERSIMLATAGLALFGAVLSGLSLTTGGAWINTIALLALAAIAALHTAVLLTLPGHGLDRALAVTFAGGTGLLTAGAAAASGWRWDQSGSVTTSILVPAAAAVAVFAGWVLAARIRSTAWRTPLRAAAWSAGVIAAGTLLPAAATTATKALDIAAGGIAAPWSEAAGSSSDVTSAHAVSALTLAVALAIIAALLAVLRLGRRALPPLAAGVVAVALLAAPITGILGVTIALWMLLAAVALALMFVDTVRPIRHSLVTATIGGTTLAWLAGWATIDLWVITGAFAIVVIIAARSLVRANGGRTAMLGGAAALVYATVSAAAAYPLTLLGFWSPAAVALTAGALLCLFSLPLVPVSIVSPLDRRVQFWTSAATAVAASALAASLLPAPNAGASAWTMTGIAALAVAGAALWAAHPANRALTAERRVALIALPPAVNWLFVSLSTLPDVPAIAREIAPISAAVLSAAGILIVVTRRPAAIRWPADAGLALATLPAVALAFAGERQHGWLVLLLAAVVALLASASRDGLFASRSPRRHLGWLALALATAALWTRLADDTVTALEPYVLPLAGALLAIAALIRRAREKNAPGRSGSPYLSAAPIVALAGLLMAVIPLSLTAAETSVADLGAAGGGPAPLRVIVMLAVGVALLVGGSVAGATAATPGAARPYLDAATLAGALGTVIVTVGHAGAVVRTGGGLLEVWAGIAVVALGGAAFAQSRPRDDTTDHARMAAGQALVVVALAGAALLESSAIQSGQAAAPRAGASIAALAAVHVVSMLVARAPLSRVVAWIALGASVIMALLHLGALPEIEYATVPIAGALIAGGAIHLARTPESRSWPWLGPGIAVLLVPSLLITVEERPLWRLVALGVIGTAVIVLGATLRLQAPFVLGSVVTLAHGVATFAPQIRAVYELADWYIWAGVGGALLVALAIRYERRIRDLRRAVSGIGALR